MTVARYDWQLQDKHDQDLDDGADLAFVCLAPILYVALFFACLWGLCGLGLKAWVE
jgi:hypothetical protein